jgi:hypothetical protein
MRTKLVVGTLYVSSFWLSLLQPINSEGNLGKAPNSESSPMPSLQEKYASPVTIRMVDMFTKETKEVPAETVPDSRRFVFRRQGLDVTNRDQADEILPIMEIRMFPLDERGRLVPKTRAKKIRIEEFGPNEMKLRWTTMVPSSRPQQ